VGCFSMSTQLVGVTVVAIPEFEPKVVAQAHKSVKGAIVEELPGEKRDNQSGRYEETRRESPPVIPHRGWRHWRRSRQPKGGPRD